MLDEVWTNPADGRAYLREPYRRRHLRGFSCSCWSLWYVSYFSRLTAF